MASHIKLLVPLDRLDGRQHTFGTYLSGWLRALRPLLEGMAVIRKSKRSYPFLQDFTQVDIPSFMEADRGYGLFFSLWAGRFGANIIHFPHRYSPYTWWGTKAKKVVTVHDTALISLPEHLVERMRKRTVWRYKRSLAGFDAVVTVSEASRNELCRHFALPMEKVRVIYHGVDERFSPGSGSKDLKVLYGVEKPYILNVSSIKKKKNIAGLVRAFGMIKKEGYPHKLVLVGKHDNGLDEVKTAIEQMNLKGEVIITGFVDEKDHPDFYRQAQVMVYPSFYEGFGLPVLEAMACGCPVIASGASSIPEVAGKAALMVDPGDTVNMYEAIKKVLEERIIREKLISLGFERAKQFTWDKTAAAHLSLYQELLEDKQSRPGKFQ